MNYLNLILTLLIFSLVHSQQGQAKHKLTSAANHLPYQAHSYNDLAITKHLLLKGVKYFKFDVSLADKPSCLKYSNWDGKISCFTSQHYSEQVCCLAMRGDAGSQNNFYYPFSTSQDFIKMMSQYLSEYGKSIDVLFAAINFQFPFEMNNHLLQNFLYQIAQLLQKYKVLRIATGEDDFIFEYDRICRQTLQSGDNLDNIACTPIRKAISDSSIMLQSGGRHPYDVRDYKGRYRNFNTYYKSVDDLCKNGFPTWQNKYPEIPLIFWQPSNQDQIQNTLRKLLSPSCARLHNRTIQGIALASNIDPQMFQIFMKEINQKGMANQFPWIFLNKKLWIQNATSVKLTSLDGVYTKISNSNERMVVSWQRKEQSGLKNYLSLFYWNDQNNEINVEKTIELQSQIKQLHSIEDTLYVIVSNDDQSKTRQFNATIISFNFKLEKIRQRIIPSYIIAYTNNNVIYYISRTSNPSYFNFYVLTRDLSNATQYGISNYMNKEQLDSVRSIYFRKKQKTDDDIFLLLGDASDHTWIAQMKFGNIHKQKTLTFGKNARIIDLQDGNIVISLEDSYSHSGVLLNNNAQNKCNFHKKQASQRLAHLPNLVNVIQGSFENLMNFFNQQSQEIITACYPNLTFSKHMNGAKVQIASVWGQLFISSEYVPLNKQDLMVSLFSGGSNYEFSLRTKTGFILTSVNANRRFKKENDLDIEQE